MGKMTYKIQSGVPRHDIIAYFESIALNNIDDSGYCGADWEAEVGEEKYRTLGSIKLTQTEVSFYAEEKRLMEIVAAYRLKFLSAGG